VKHIIDVGSVPSSPTGRTEDMTKYGMCIKYSSDPAAKSIRLNTRTSGTLRADGIEDDDSTHNETDVTPHLETSALVFKVVERAFEIEDSKGKHTSARSSVEIPQSTEQSVQSSQSSIQDSPPKQTKRKKKWFPIKRSSSKQAIPIVDGVLVDTPVAASAESVFEASSSDIAEVKRLSPEGCLDEIRSALRSVNPEFPIEVDGVYISDSIGGKANEFVANIGKTLKDITGL